MFKLLLFVAFGQCASAAVLEAPTATITAAPLVRRDVTTVGYRSTGYSSGTTLWGTVVRTMEPSHYMTTSGSLYRRCTSSTTCRFFSCVGGYAVFGTSSTYCGTVSGSTCSYDVLYTDISDRNGKTNYWCDDSTLTGWRVFATTPSGRVSSSTSSTTTTTTSSSSTSTTSSSSISIGSDSSSSIPSSSTIFVRPGSNSGPSDEPQTGKKSVPIAPIVGGAVGGIAIISIAIVVAIVLLRRKKNDTPPAAAAANPPVYYEPPPPTTHYPAGGPVVVEKTPGVMTTNVNPYYVNSGSGPTSPVPQYTPNNASGPTSPVPQYTPHNGAINELPAARM